jgi:phenylpropionate dioxygenase-like ring-hydroxylating dioxygenase large terminal subunit
MTAAFDDSLVQIRKTTAGAIRIGDVRFDVPEEGRLLPPQAFWSPEVFEAELRQIFERGWVHVADLPELGQPGDFVASDIGRTPVVVVRGEDGRLRGFVNACRHRGATLAEGAGNCGKQLRCPYHAWSYTTKGALVGVPYREEFCGREQGLDLIPVRVATAGPLVFACLDADAPPFEKWAGDLVPTLERARGAEMVAAYEYEYDVPCNWKVYVENGMEGYHIGFVHDVLADFVQQRDEARHFFEEHASYTHAPISPQYREMIPRPPHFSEEEATRVRFGHVFPNLIPVVTPGDFSYLRIDPITPERIRLRARSFDLGGPAEGMREFRRDAFDRTNKQDIGVVTRVQRGLRARTLPAGIHSNHLEARIGHFERMVARELLR